MSKVHASSQAEPVGAHIISLGRTNGWVRRPSEARRELNHGLRGVSAFADQVEFTPGVTRTKAEIAERTEELYGPAYDPRA